MATIGQERHNRNLLRGVSSFWSRFFKDKELLENLYSATDELMGQLYLELLESLLANSIKDVPVFSKEFWKLLTFNSTEVEIIGVEYKYPITSNIKQIKFLYNKIFEPTSIQEDTQDFRIEDGFIYFKKNIFDDLEFPGYAKRRSGNSTIISMWAPESLVDKEYVYEHFGRMLKIYEPSSESYKAFIRGIWFYYMNGPTINRIKSAMNIIGGYPVATEDGEIVLSIRLVSGVYYVKTTTALYEIDAKVELDVQVGDVLSAFQSLTKAYTVTDYIDDPNWFDHIIVPIEIIPSLSTFDRTTNVKDSTPIFIGYPILIGTPGWYIGAGGFPNFMWLLFNQVLKYNIFYVTYDALASDFVRTPEDLKDIVLSGKPAFDYALTVPYLNLTETVDTPQEDTLQMKLDYSIVESYSHTDIDESLALENVLELSEEEYGQFPVAFGDSPTLIGSGIIGDADARFNSGVPELIGTNTIGKVDDGLYSEFPLEIQVI